MVAKCQECIRCFKAVEYDLHLFQEDCIFINITVVTNSYKGDDGSSRANSIRFPHVLLWQNLYWDIKPYVFLLEIRTSMDQTRLNIPSEIIKSSEPSKVFVTQTDLNAVSTSKFVAWFAKKNHHFTSVWRWYLAWLYLHLSKHKLRFLQPIGSFEWFV